MGNQAPSPGSTNIPLSFCSCFDPISLARRRKNGSDQLQDHEVVTLLRKSDSMVDTISWNQADDESYKENHRYVVRQKSRTDDHDTSQRSEGDSSSSPDPSEPDDTSSPPSTTSAASRIEGFFRRNPNNTNNDVDSPQNDITNNENGAVAMMISFTESQQSGLLTASGTYRIEARSDPSFIRRTNSPGEREDIEDYPMSDDHVDITLSQPDQQQVLDDNEGNYDTDYHVDNDDNEEERQPLLLP